jgi:hypothetical protein
MSLFASCPLEPLIVLFYPLPNLPPGGKETIEAGVLFRMMKENVKNCRGKAFPPWGNGKG